MRICGQRSRLHAHQFWWKVYVERDLVFRLQHSIDHCSAGGEVKGAVWRDLIPRPGCEGFIFEDPELLDWQNQAAFARPGDSVVRWFLVEIGDGNIDPSADVPTLAQASEVSADGTRVHQSRIECIDIDEEVFESESMESKNASVSNGACVPPLPFVLSQSL